MMGWMGALRLRAILFDQSRRRLCHFTHVVQAEQEEKESTWDLTCMGDLIINPPFGDSLNPNHKEGEGIGMVDGSQGLRVYHSRWNLYEHQPIPVYMSFIFESCWLNLDVIRVKFDMEFRHVRSGPGMCRTCTLFPRRLQVLRKLRDDQEDLLMKLELSDDFSHTVVAFSDQVFPISVCTFQLAKLAILAGTTPPTRVLTNNCIFTTQCEQRLWLSNKVPWHYAMITGLDDFGSESLVTTSQFSCLWPVLYNELINFDLDMVF